MSSAATAPASAADGAASAAASAAVAAATPATGRGGALPSIAGRLSRVLLRAAVAWGVAVSAVVGFAVHHEVDELMDSALQESAEILYGLLSYNAAQLPVDGGGALPAPPHAERLVWQLLDAQGQVRLRSHHAPDAALLTGPPAGLRHGLRGDRVYGLPYGAQGWHLVVAQPAADRRAAQWEAMLITVLAALGVGALCAWWLGRGVARELVPLQALSGEVGRYQPMEPGSALPAAQRAELAPLRDAGVALGQRLAQRVASERAVAAHAAHALRTPLAGLAAQLAVAQREGDAAIQPRLERARQAADRLRRVVAALLTLFRAGVEPVRRPVALEALVASLPVDGLQVQVEGRCEAAVDADLLAAALANLLDNTVRHGGQTLTCRFAQDAAGTTLLLHDDGPGVSAQRLQQLQQALDHTGGEPAIGMGLALADQVARAHGGRLQLLPVAQGFAVALRLGRG